MNDDDDIGAGSFDPKTWGNSTRPRNSMPSSPVPGNDSADSFDVRGWGLDDSDQVTPDTRPEMAEEDGVAHDPARRRLIAGIGSGVAILAAGALFAFAMRDASAPPAMPDEAPPMLASGDEKPSTRTLLVASPRDILAALTTSGVAPDQARAVVAQALPALDEGTGDVRLAFTMVGPAGHARIAAFEASHGDGSGVAVTATEAGFAVERIEARLTTQIRVVRGELDAESFYSSAVSAGVTDSLISDVANAFAFDFDMQQEVAPGDVFEVAFEQRLNPSGQAVGVPRLLYVSLSTDAKSRALYRFLAPGDSDAGWYDGNGSSTVRSLMRTPVDSARISSKFGYRIHPIQGYKKLHRGTDFAAPIGTPMYASGDAVVNFVGPRGAAGNFVILDHDNGWQTRYMHLNRFADGMAAGVRVRQGQQIGEVGNTGGSTGPHLHYEIWIDGEPVDPQSIDTGTGKTLGGEALAAFVRERDRIDSSRAGSSQ